MQRRPIPLIPTLAMSAVFAAFPVVSMASDLPMQDLLNGGWVIFALAFVAIWIGVVVFLRGNLRHAEHFVQHRDWPSLRATLWRSRKSRR